MRAEVIKFILAQCSTVPPMWNMEQAVQLLQYCDSCWFLPDNIRQSWIDERRLRVMGLGGTHAAITSTSGVFARHLNISTGPPENSHKLLDDLFMRLQLNRDVMTVAVRVSGKDAHGRDGVGVFDYEMKRLADLRGTVPKESVDLRLSTARAALCSCCGCSPPAASTKRSSCTTPPPPSCTSLAMSGCCDTPSLAILACAASPGPSRR